MICWHRLCGVCGGHYLCTSAKPPGSLPLGTSWSTVEVHLPCLAVARFYQLDATDEMRSLESFLLTWSENSMQLVIELCLRSSVFKDVGEIVAGLVGRVSGRNRRACARHIHFPNVSCQHRRFAHWDIAIVGNTCSTWLSQTLGRHGSRQHRISSP